ncbi:MAG: FliI/YscN family ATPase [Gammaproteobacteria bacterium]|nr:FliI/YscN family ATPase [Gammaproteobacteria bacterium]
MSGANDILQSRLQQIHPVQHIGRVVQAFGTSVRVSGLRARIGQRCLISDKATQRTLLADVVGLVGGEAVLFPLGSLQGIAIDSEVTVLEEQTEIGIGRAMLGKVLDGLGQVLGGGEEFVPELNVPLERDAPDPMSRRPIDQVFCTGVKAIDSVLTVGVGQRIGIFATAGGGKSTLLSMLARHSSADLIVIALIGERGREVREFIDQNLGSEGLRRSVLIVATSDRPAMERVKAAATATAIAEGFREQGLNVLLLVDSVTRYARALREIGLSVGEAPVRRGFPPSVFSELPKLFERAGNDAHGSITAFYTVLTEDDDAMDPISEETRSILDGHIVLSRSLAEKGHYPAIDVLPSISRLFPQLADEDHREAATRLRRLLSDYREVEFLLRVGEYEAGRDPEVDAAVERHPSILAFLQQSMSSPSDLQQTLTDLQGVVQ